MVEFALCSTVLFLIMFAIMFFGRYYLVSQVLLYAAQEGVKIASRTPNLSNAQVRDGIRGFAGKAAFNPSSPIYVALGSANLLSNNNTGNLPNGAKIEILPWDSDGTAADTIPPGTIGVRIDYPFQLCGNVFSGAPSQVIGVWLTLDQQKGSAVTFNNFTLTQRAIAAQEIYQN